MGRFGIDGALGLSVRIQNQGRDARSRIMLMPVMCVRPVGMRKVGEVDSRKGPPG